MTFAGLLADAQGGDGTLRIALPETWHQGRTAYGGFSAAFALAAAMRAGGEGLPPLRSAQLAMIAPVAGEVEARAQVLRRGRNATWVSAELVCGGSVAFTASLAFMGAVDSSLHVNDCPVPQGLVPRAEARDVTFTEHTPAFLRNNFTSRHALSPAPEPKGEMCRWVRLNDAQGLDPMVALVLLADALPPGVMPLLTARVPVSTMHWQVNLLTPAPLTDDGWWLLKSSGDYAEKGCSSQRMDIWNAAGEPVLAGMQSVALFG